MISDEALAVVATSDGIIHRWVASREGVASNTRTHARTYAREGLRSGRQATSVDGLQQAGAWSPTEEATFVSKCEGVRL